MIFGLFLFLILGFYPYSAIILGVIFLLGLLLTVEGLRDDGRGDDDDEDSGSMLVSVGIVIMLLSAIPFGGAVVYNYGQKWGYIAYPDGGYAKQPKHKPELFQ